jgi:hypothetical protein
VCVCVIMNIQYVQTTKYFRMNALHTITLCKTNEQMIRCPSTYEGRLGYGFNCIISLVHKYTDIEARIHTHRHTHKQKQK